MDSNRDVSENPDNIQLPLPVEFWKMFHTSVPSLFDNNENDIVPRLAEVIRKCREHHEYYVLSVVLRNQGEYKAKLPYYIAFTNWLLGQLVRATAVERLERFHSQFEEWQISIVELLATRNQHMFVITMLEYLSAIKELAEIRSGPAQGPVMVQWFKSGAQEFHSEASVSSQPPVETLQFDNGPRCASVLIHLLTVVRSQTVMLSHCAPHALQQFWSSLLVLLRDSSQPVVVATLKSITANIDASGFPQSLISARTLCVVLESLVNLLSSKYCGNCDANEAVRNTLVAVAGSCRAVRLNRGTGCEVNDTHLFHTLVSLLEFENPFLYSASSSEEYCNLLAFLMKKFSGSVDIEPKMLALLGQASHFPAILLVVETLITKDLDGKFLNPLEDSRTGIDVRSHSSLWAKVTGLATHSIALLRSPPTPISGHLQAARLLTGVTLMAANLSLHFPHIPLVLFGDQFYKQFNRVVLDSDLSQVYRELVLSSKNLVSLQEVTLIDVCEVHKLLVFLSLPWLKEMTSHQLPTVNLSPYLDMANLQLLPDDASIKCECVVGLVSRGGGLAPAWRLAVLSLTRSRADTSLCTLRLLPRLLNGLTAIDEQAAVLASLVHPYFCSADPELLVALAKFLPQITCSLAGTTCYMRDDSDEWCVTCKVCETDGEAFYVKGPLEAKAISLLDKYLQLRSSQVVEVRQNIATSLQHWNKHIQESALRPYLVKWLALIKDPAPEVRTALARVAKFLLSADSDPEFLQLYEDVGWAIAQRSLATCDKNLQLSVLATLYNIGCIPIDNVLWPTLKAFILLLSHPSVINPSVAQIYIKKIAAVRKKSVQDIFFRFQDKIFKILSVMLVHNYLFNKKCVPITMLNTARGLGFENPKELLDSSARKYLIKHLLPAVIARPQTQDLLLIVAQLMQTDLSKLLENSFQYFYPHVILFEEKDVQESVFKLMESYTGLPLQRVIRWSFKVIACELLLYFHQEKEKATQALMELKTFETEGGIQSGSTSIGGDISQFIQPRFLAVLAYLDSLLVSSSGCEGTKRLGLQVLPDLLRLLGTTHVTPVRFKLLATLRSSLSLHKQFPDLIFSAWRAFVLNVSTVGPLLSTIFVSLLPLLDQYPVEISSVFHILVVDNLESVRGHLAELYFLPDSPPTHQIYELVQKELASLRQLPVKEQLAATLQLATHDNADVRLRGLRKLRSKLRKHRQTVRQLVTTQDNMNPFIIKLLEALICGCRDTNEGVRLASAQCLGEVGALDPGHLPSKVNMEAEGREMLVIDSNAFVICALNEFVRAFQAASHTTIMDTFAFGIQELLKSYDVVSRGVWDQLSDSTKEIVSPFLESRYQDLASKSDHQPLIPHPIFGTIYGATFNAWAVNWVSGLIPIVTDEFVRKVFSVCQLGIKKDLQTLQFFLPYIVLYAILGASKSQSKRISEEMSAVVFRVEDSRGAPADSTPRTLLTGGSAQEPPPSPDESLTHTLCAKTVYELFDFLYRWLRQTKERIVPNKLTTEAQQYHSLNEFLKTFSKLDIAEGSYRFKDYTRALLFLEDYIAEHPNTLQSYLPSLGKIYYHLHDPDSFRGIIAIHETEPTAREIILYHQVTGQLQDAAACYERLQQDNVSGEDFHKDMVQCYLAMDQPSTALQLAQGFLNGMEGRQQCVSLLDEQAEAMLSLSMFPQLELLLSGAGEGGWGASVGRALLHLARGHGDLMVDGLDTIRQSLVRALTGCSVSQSGIRHGYDVIVKLHIITELEKLGSMVLEMLECKNVAKMEELFHQVVRDDLDKQLEVVQPSCRVLQPVLCMRRVVLSLANHMFTDRCPDILPLFNTEIGNSWLKSIEINRKSGHYQQAYNNILTVEPYRPKGLFVEKAQLLWAKGEPEGALHTLHRGLEHHFPDMADFKNLPNNARADDRRLCAEAKLLIAIYNDENVNIDMDTNMNNYTGAVEVCKNWEKSIVCLAQYKYKYLRTVCENAEFQTKMLEDQVYMINYFGKSLQYGCEYIYQSMPRMLTIWLDFGTQLAQDMLSRNTPHLAERRATMDKMTTLIGTYIERLPTYMFMTAFSQLISRICHPQKDCYKILRAIIIKIIIAYPQQALWMFLSVYKSPYTVRVKRCEEVLRSSEIQKEGELCRTINDFRDLFERLIELGNKQPSGNARGTVTVSIKSFLISLYRLVSSPSFSRIVIPLQKFRTISLPRSTATKYHNPFPDDMVYISGMKDDVVVLSSLQRPKKITFIGTDGKHYPMMCKPNDDLRLDSRMMEFNSIVNMYLQRDPEARDRGLYIRTYSAVPLSDASGLIEWVPNLVGLRIVIGGAYKQMGMAVTAKEYREICCHKNDPLSKKRQVFIEKLLPRHPAVLRQWYLRQFSHPTTWYLARSGLVRTLAVMSIVGFMLGLGDRHGENILLDSTCGDVVHVDFNCLFNKGERFDWPERVPFRLTHNLVDAMGPTGVEGLFRHSCEITTRVMRQQMDQLMSVVRPFCYDPLVSWNTDKNSRDENAEMTNNKAMEDIQNIESRLQGIVRMKNRAQTIPLSVEGQVRTLIAEATNIDNLCQMYVGWGPYL